MTITSLTSRAVVVTVVHQRHDHLLRSQQQLAALSPGTPRVVVSMGDPEVASLLDRPELAGSPVEVVELTAGPPDLPLAAARNAGARAAIALGASVLVFLDVDCLVGPDTVTAYRTRAEQYDEHLLAGAVTYLSAEAMGTVRASGHRHAGGADVDLLRRLRDPHPARPDPRDSPLLATDHALFWSLSFAVTTAAWRRIGGFDEAFTGYGGEDTDFALRARDAGLGLVWIPGADTWHQHHEVEDPPVRHVVSICRNANLFHARHGRWPMEGWLAGFEAAGLAALGPDGWCAVR